MTKLIVLTLPTCQPCKAMAPDVERLKQEQGIEVEKLNAAENTELCRTYGVRGVPTMLLMDDNKLLKQHTGALTYDELKDFVAG